MLGSKHIPIEIYPQWSSGFVQPRQCRAITAHLQISQPAVFYRGAGTCDIVFVGLPG